MKNFLSKSLVLGGIILTLGHSSEGVFAKPIQLIPQHEQLVEQSSNDTPLFPDQGATGFWEGTPPSLIETYFPKLPLRLTSPLLREMRSQLIKEKYADLLHNRVYEKALLSLLVAEGDLEKAKEYLSETSFSDKQSLLLDLFWLAGEDKKACEKITNFVQTSPEFEWKKQNIYCLYLNGEKERAKIAAEILRETQPSAVQSLDMVFDSSVKQPFTESFANSPFLLTVWIESGREISEDDLKKISPPSLALIARSEKVPFETRQLAAEKALQEGTFSASAFLALIQKMPESSFWAQCLHELSSGKTKELLPLLEHAEKEGKLGIVFYVFNSLLSSLTPSEDGLSLSPFMIRGFLQSEHKDLAQKWGSFFMRESPDEAIAVLPLLHLAFPESKWGASQMQAWQVYEERMHPQTAAQRSYDLRRVLEALKESSGSPMKGEPSSPSWRQEKGLLDEKTLTLLESAAESHRRGEVLLLGLVLIGESSLADLSVDRLVPILRAFDKAGYKMEARSLAIAFLLVHN